MDDKLLQRAKKCVDAMAQGINPFTGEIAKAPDSLSDERLQWCMGYVSQVLHNVTTHIKQERDPSKPKRTPFAISNEQKSKIELSNEPIGVNEIARRINAVIDVDSMRAVSGAKIASWLADNGYLDTVTDPVIGKSHKRVNDKGKALGISETQAVNVETGQPYIKPVYNTYAQKFIVAHIEQINTRK